MLNATRVVACRRAHLSSKEQSRRLGTCRACNHNALERTMSHAIAPRGFSFGPLFMTPRLERLWREDNSRSHACAGLATSEHPPASRPQGESYLSSTLHLLPHSDSLFFLLFSGSRTDNDIAWPKPSSCGNLMAHRLQSVAQDAYRCCHRDLCVYSTPSFAAKKNPHRFLKYPRVRLSDFRLDFFTSRRDPN